MSTSILRPRIELTTDHFDLLRVLLALSAVVIGASIISKGIFLQPENIGNVLEQNSLLLILGVAQFFVILVGGIDLSVGAVVALSSVLFVSFLDYGTPAALSVAMIGGCAVGLLNGVLVTFVRLPSFVVTLGTMQIVYSLAKVFTGGGTLHAGRDGAAIPNSILQFFQNSFAGIPLPLLTFAGVLVVASIYLHSAYGRYLYAIGGNDRAAYLSGIPVAGSRVAAYIFASTVAAAAGVLFVARVGYGDPQAGTWLPLDSIAAVSIGGASMKGGRGTVVAVVAGVLIIAVLNNVMNLLGAPPTLQPTIKGGIIVLAVYVYMHRRA